MRLLRVSIDACSRECNRGPAKALVHCAAVVQSSRTSSLCGGATQFVEVGPHACLRCLPVIISGATLSLCWQVQEKERAEHDVLVVVLCQGHDDCAHVFVAPVRSFRD